jgi:UDP-N-acetylmuramoyl-tripeptide--D-alanyl-D-alanine ligase
VKPVELSLRDGLPTGNPGRYADRADDAGKLDDSRGRDGHGHQGIAGAQMKMIANALEKRFSGRTALDEAAA